MVRRLLRSLPRRSRAFVVAVGTLLVLAACVHAAPPAGYTPYWSEEFDQGIGSQPDTTRWTYDLGSSGWGNNEWENYVNDAAHAHIISDSQATDGQALLIQATTDGGSGKGHYTSARIKTQGKVSFTYGYIEGRIQMPYGKGIWPAFWMLGTDITSVSWPACGEIDIMENVGNELSAVHGSLHGTGYSGGNPLTGTYTLPGGQLFRDAYHTFGVRWRPDAISFTVDGIAYENRTVADLPAGTAWAFNKAQFLILNLAVGGNWPGYPDATTVFPQNYKVDYIRIYKFLPPVGRIVTLRSAVNSRFVTSDAAGVSPLIASQPTAGISEQFQVVDAGSGAVALKSLASNRFVSAPTSTGSLLANKTTISNAEKFLWVDAGSGNVALKSLGTNQFVCAENAGAGALIANRTVVSTWESFSVNLQSDAVSALLCAAGVVAPPSAEAARLNVEAGADSAGVEICDAVRLFRKANGLDT